MTEAKDKVDLLYRLFAPHIAERIDAFRQSNQRLVHYTSAEAMVAIVQGKMVWLRSASIMNDYTEIEHGLQCLGSAWRSDHGAELRALLDSLSEGLSDHIAQTHDASQAALKYDTYLLSVSRHRDSEDKLGRLSMWRAYGGKDGVALVLNNTAFVSESDALAAYTLPVFYQSTDQFVAWFGGWVEKLKASKAELSKLTADELTAYVHFAFRLFALATKHPGFHEEEEWRVVYSPNIEASSRLRRMPVLIRGTPQIVYGLPLQNVPEENFIGAEVNELIDQVIVGPSDSPWNTREALVAILEDAGLSDAENRVCVSTIPLRD